MDAFSPMPGDLGSFADWLEGKANEIASMTVRRQESYNEEVWVDDPVVT
jgi:hypothetical protein